MPSAMIPSKPFYYLRHGQTDWNRDLRWQGQTDVPLNDTGRQQAEDAQKCLVGLPITHLVSSPLSRARETADIVNAVLGLPITDHPGLMEVGFGVMEGSHHSLGDYTNRWRTEGYTPDGAESFAVFTDRVLTTLAQLLHADGTPLIVAHGGVFWPIQDALGLAVNGNLPNARPVMVYPTEQGWDWATL